MSPNVKRRTKLLAAAGMILTTIIWGSAFVVMKNSMDVIKPTYLLAYRFTIATAGLILIFRKQVKSMTWADIKCGALLGIFLFHFGGNQVFGVSPDGVYVDCRPVKMHLSQRCT